MKYLAALFLFLTCGIAAADSIAFVNVNVLPMTSETVLEEQTVVVTDGRITSLGAVASTGLPDDAMVIDGTDRFLLPGLVEMHGHVPGDTGASLQRVMELYLVNGITTVRGMLGRAVHLELRQELLEGNAIGPRLVTSGPSLNGRSVDGPSQARRMVQEQHAAGYDFLKIHPGLSREEFDAIAETANELGIPFAGHVPEDVGVHAALQSGIASIDHLDGYMETLMPANTDTSGGFAGFFGLFLADQADMGKIQGIAAATADAGVWNVPTQSLFEHVVSTTPPDLMVDWPEMKYMPVETVSRWQKYKQELMAEEQYSAETAEKSIRIRQQLILELFRQDAGLLLGSDSPQIFNVPGFALHRELQMLVDAGLSPYSALVTGTVNPASYFGRENSTGKIKVGFDADLVLLDASPLQNISNSRRVHGVMTRGQWFSRQQLDQMLQQLER